MQLEKEYKEASRLHSETEGEIHEEEAGESMKSLKGIDIPIDPERKLDLRLELEFENIN